MSVIRNNLFYIIIGLVGAGSIGLAVWSVMGADDIQQSVNQLKSLNDKVRGINQSNAANPETIKVAAENSQVRKDRFERIRKAAVGPQRDDPVTGQPRELLIPRSLPEPESDAARITFKKKYLESLDGLLTMLNARGEPTPEEIEAMRNALGGGSTASADGETPAWRPEPVQQVIRTGDDGGTDRTSLLRRNAASVAAEKIARRIYMYASRETFGPHPALAGDDDEKPDVETIWHAQVQYWTAKDFAVALARLNNARAEKLKAEDRGYDAWVANMPVKRWSFLRMDDKLGRGGGINVTKFAPSHTNEENDASHFVVNLRLDLIIEEAALYDVLDAVVSAGYYTPIGIKIERVDQNPLQEEYVYGDAPIIALKIDLEAYYFRSVYEQWIPEELKPILATKDAVQLYDRDRRP